MNIKSQHVVGLVAGVAVTAGGFYLYKKNQAKVDGWLRQQGINVPGQTASDPSSMSLEELVVEKERLEDMIAEREMTANQSDSPV